jgi:hypothetical protein
MSRIFFNRSLLVLAVLVLGVNLSCAGETNAVPKKIPALKLSDQYDHPQRIDFPRTNLFVLTVADRAGSKGIDAWVRPLKQRYGDRFEILGVADLGKVPGFMQGFIKRMFKKEIPHPVMCDWSGDVAKNLVCEKDRPNIFVVGRTGEILYRVAGTNSPSAFTNLCAALDRAAPLAK